MRKWLKSVLAVLLVACLAGSLFGCAVVEGLQENDEWNNDPSVVSRNKEIAHVPLFSYGDAAAAVANDYRSSDNFLSLNGSWMFKLVTATKDIPDSFMKPAFDAAEWASINVPGNWETQGFSQPTYTFENYAWSTTLTTPPAVTERSNEIGLYRRTVDVPASWQGREIYITLEGVESACYVYVNGMMVGYGEDSYTTKDFRITSYLKYGETNTVAVKVFKYSDGSWLEAQDALKLGGIFRDVYLRATPKKQIKDVKFTYKFTADYASALLYADVDIGAYDNAGSGEYVEISLYNADGSVFMEPTRLAGRVRYEKKKSGGAFIASVNNKISVSGMKLWSAETPNLYTAVVGFYAEDGTLLDMVSQRIGFREMTFDVSDAGDKILSVNGKAVKLFGVNYNEHSATNGKAMTREEMVEDIKTLKSLNVNAVRSAGVPLSQTFISLCDEYGLYVISELNLETQPWTAQGAQSLPGDQAIWQAAVLDRLTNVLYRDKNNASVVLWSLGNESGVGSNISTARNWLIENDDRLVVYNAYYTEDDYGNISFKPTGDIISTSGWNKGKLNEIMNDDTVTAPLFVTDLEAGLLNGGGDFRYYTGLLDASGKVQGVFLSFYKDRTMYLGGKTLQYPVSWEKINLVTDPVMAKSGLVSGDGTLQSEAYELKNAYAPIFVAATDVKAGRFTVSNRFADTAFENNFTLSYTVTKNGTDVLKNATVSGLTLAAGETKEITLDYGNISVVGDVFVTVTVSYAKKPVWAGATFDNVLCAQTFDVSGNVKPVKNGSSVDVSGTAFALTEFAAPTIYTTETALAKGIVYVSNPGDYAFNDLFELKYQVLEKNGYWNNPVWFVRASGTVNTASVGACAAYKEVNAGYNIKASDKSTFRVLFTFTSKKAVGNVEAGTEWTVEFNAATFNLGTLPFAVSASENPTPVYEKDDKGNDTTKQAKDENGNPLWVGGPLDREDLIYEELSEEEMGVAPESFCVLKNDRVEISFDVATGLIRSYAVNGKTLLTENSNANASMLLSLMRDVTGSDYLSDVGEEDNLARLIYASSVEGKELTNGLRFQTVGAGHVRATLEYRLYGSDPSRSYLLGETSAYNVVYDLYADGSVGVSVALRLDDAAGIPTEIANLLTLDSSLDCVTWYGRGSGETYADKKYDSTVSVFKDSAKAMSLTGDRSETRWVTFTDASGNGVMVTSDDNLFAFNVAKAYPWEDVPYADDAKVLARPYNIVHIVGAQRGVSAGSAVEEQYLNAGTSLVAGGTYTYTFRLKPVTSADGSAEAAKTLPAAGKAVVAFNPLMPTERYALHSKAMPDSYLTVNGTDLTMNKALGSLSQTYYRLFTNITTASGEKTYAYQNLKNLLWLTPSETDAKAQNIVELGFAKRDTSLKWQSWYQNGTEITSAGTSYVISLYDKLALHAARMVTIKSEKDTFTAFSVVVDPTNKDNAMLQNTFNNLYLTAADSVSYANPVIEELDTRRINYPVTTNWGVAQEKIDRNDALWIQLLGRATLTDLLPGQTQEWTFAPAGAGTYTITSATTGRRLGVEKTMDYTTMTEVLTVVAVDPNSDLSDIETLWTLDNLGGYWRIACPALGVVLQCEAKRDFMSKTDRDFNNIVNVDDAIDLLATLTVGSWKNAASQKWELSSEADRRTDLVIGSAWLDPVNNHAQATGK